MFDNGRALIWSACLGSVYIEDSVCPSPVVSTLFHTQGRPGGKDRPTLPDALCGGQAGIQTLTCVMQSTHTRFYMCLCSHLFVLYHTVRGTHMIYHRNAVQSSHDVWGD